MVHRFAIGLAWKLDKRQKNADKVLPPSAALCHSHERLNAFLIRSVFLAFINEVSADHMRALRAWPGKNPAVAAFLTRIDSFHALWVSSVVFEALFGTAPHDGRYVRVQNNCEACILAAIGANGRTLADLYGWLTVRRDETKKFNKEARTRGDTCRKREVYAYRVVKAWIKHLKPEDGDEVWRCGDEIATELKQIWPPITKAKEAITVQRRNETVRHQEIRPIKDGTAPLIDIHGHSLGFDIELLKAHQEATALQHKMAGLHTDIDDMSVYREDTVVDGDAG
jgi:hypothetical protein